MGLLDHDTYIIERKLLAWNNTSIIRDAEGNEIGRGVNRETKQGEVTLYDSRKKILGKAIGYNLYDQNAKFIGRVKHKKSSWRLPYWIEDQVDKRLYEFGGNFKGTLFSMRDMNGEEVAVIRKKFLRRGHFTIKIKKMDSLTANLGF